MTEPIRPVQSGIQRRRGIPAHQPVRQPGHRRTVQEDAGTVPHEALQEARLLRSTYDELLVLAEFRNALTHGRMVDDQHLAGPTATAVDAMRRVRNQLLDPPTVLTVLQQGQLLTVSPGSSVRQALDLMYEHDFSQLPVYDSSTFVGRSARTTRARSC